MEQSQSLKTWQLWLVATTLTTSGTVLVGDVEVTAQEFLVDTSILVVPNAIEIIVDVPSAFHWSRYQYGPLGDFTYTIYPDGSAKIMSGSERLIEVAQIECAAALMCTIIMPDDSIFTVPVEQGLRPVLPDTFDASSAAIYVARWILTGTAPMFVAEPQTVPVPPENGPSGTGLANSDENAVQPVIETAIEFTEEPSDLENVDVEGGTRQDTSSSIATLGVGPQGPVVDVEPNVENNHASEIQCDEVDPFFPELCTGPRPQQEIVPEITTPPVVTVAPHLAPTGALAQTPAEPVVLPEVEPDDEGWSFSDLSCSATASASLAALDGGNAKPRISLGCGTQITDRLSVRGALIGYAIPSQQEDFDPDYTYAVNYKVNDRVNVSYSNYSASFSNTDGALSGLLEGNLRASFKLPDIPLPNDRLLPCTASTGLPDPTGSSVNLSCGYAITPDLRVGATVYLYLTGEQDELSPDYSYTLSYRINDSFRVSYNNYSNNRFPWNRGSSPRPGLTGGSISLSHQIEF
ncbi:hypothetical protein DS901_12880 [Loktanella sp. D2R18]|uniref:hypothetical protein n=1 Tax=Rhodobacterales TaxID=204455 RepID=UPI000DE999EF|nr:MULTISPECIES: hypothetical protein [Rhodobacterales]MDO6591880.1 hypothetical protein [Yoonia sp. 1_MG-2023]RBW42688.1 hypothetical protein DS901_12880 [Loktanella sp. D2R18]